MIDTTLKAAFRVLVDELENATARCKSEVESEVFDPDHFVDEVTDLVDEILESEEAPQQEGSLLVSVETLKALRVAVNDVTGGDVEHAFRDFAWEMRKAFREFTEALTMRRAA
jgi:hypothetical protein